MPDIHIGDKTITLPLFTDSLTLDDVWAIRDMDVINAAAHLLRSAVADQPESLELLGTVKLKKVGEIFQAWQKGADVTLGESEAS